MVCQDISKVPCFVNNTTDISVLIGIFRNSVNSVKVPCFVNLLFSYFEKLWEILNMHYKDDPFSDMHAKIFIFFMYTHVKPLSGSSKCGSVFWSRLLRRGPVEYNYPIKSCVLYRPPREQLTPIVEIK